MQAVKERIWASYGPIVKQKLIFLQPICSMRSKVVFLQHFHKKGHWIMPIYIP